MAGYPGRAVCGVETVAAVVTAATAAVISARRRHGDVQAVLLRLAQPVVEVARPPPRFDPEVHFSPVEAVGGGGGTAIAWKSRRR